MAKYWYVSRLQIRQIAKFGDIWRRYFFMNKRLENKWSAPLDSPYSNDLGKTPKSTFHGTCRTFYKQQIRQTNDLNQTSSFSFALKLHAKIPLVDSHFWGAKANLHLTLSVWTIFLPCLLSKKKVCKFTLSDEPIQNETFVRFDLQQLQFELKSFCDGPFPLTLVPWFVSWVKRAREINLAL